VFGTERGSFRNLPCWRHCAASRMPSGRRMMSETWSQKNEEGEAGKSGKGFTTAGGAPTLYPLNKCYTATRPANIDDSEFSSATHPQHKCYKPWQVLQIGLKAQMTKHETQGKPETRIRKKAVVRNMESEK